MTELLLAGASGFALGASLIIAIGAQNAFVLRLGLLRAHVFIVCFICALSDALLIVLGVAGMGAVVNANPALLRLIAGAGAAFLLAYAALALRRAFSDQALHAARGSGKVPSLRAAILQCLAFTFLNPHVYLDTVVLVGGFSAAYQGTTRLAFAIGAVAASFAWFFSLGYGARLLAPFFASPLAWRMLDLAIAAIMALLAATLLRQVFA